MSTEPTNAELAKKIDTLTSGMTSGFSNVKKQFAKIEQQIESLAVMTANEFEGVNKRFDRLEDTAITSYKLYKDLDARVTVLEKAVIADM